MEKKKVLLGSPVCQKSNILREFLDSLTRLEQENVRIEYIFVDDNHEEESSRQLLLFAQNKPVRLYQSVDKEKNPETYVCDDATHYWKDHLIWKVAKFKDFMIQKAIEGSYDYLFLIDSDLLLYPRTITHLIETGKDIISEIFWTRWYPENPELPNVWLYDSYDMVRRLRGESLTPEEQMKRQQAFLNQLKVPGVYEVGGLGACTLISRKALLQGISFREIENLTLWGEDRHFCIRAKALGLDLFVDTYYPAYHIYRESVLAGVSDFKKKCDADKGRLEVKERINEKYLSVHRPKLTLSMIMKNEANRYLEKVLEEHRHYIDEAVIIDDGSTDNSVDLCRKILRGIPYQIIQNPVSKFQNEVELRKQQWEETVQTNPEWILNLDADEMFERKFKEKVQDLICNPDVDLYFFRLYDFWDDNHYREDKYWQAHSIYRPFLIRYRPDFQAEWNETPLHCGRFPQNITMLSYALGDLRIKHLGWADPKDRLAKYLRYLQLDPESRYGWKEQYESILDPNPGLVEWEESPLR